ncbi:TetR/AcrR family transcriptional regulator [Rhizobium sp. C1]|uniref:TetR/AcrR family transcriptional regulator n=1 Tax=Rhizobium sp. C1 TaxID=1349799 RepID=UPI001E558226|nr:TetR/AcrR family transcriptional regulator [Rhizobium sp. C1]MCD2179235.1 TetR/AcrR family transcriptional regulator [Rhizobium sp. C1]
MTAIGELSAVSRTRNSLQAHGRLGAGENPAKRDQILDGAKKVFAANGYDGASMNDITKAAGVSKGTIYVYFNNKEELFAGLIQRERERIFDAVSSILVDDKPLEEVLFNFGMMFGRHMTDPNTVRSLRMVLGVIDDMPEVANMFLNCGPTRGAYRLKDYLATRAARGELALDDPLLAARQFADLCTAGLFKPCLFNERNQPEDAEIETTVRAAIRVFMKAYAA